MIPREESRSLSIAQSNSLTLLIDRKKKILGWVSLEQVVGFHKEASSPVCPRCYFYCCSRKNPGLATFLFAPFTLSFLLSSFCLFVDIGLFFPQALSNRVPVILLILVSFTDKNNLCSKRSRVFPHWIHWFSLNLKTARNGSRSRAECWIYCTSYMVVSSGPRIQNIRFTLSPVGFRPLTQVAISNIK